MRKFLLIIALGLINDESHAATIPALIPIAINVPVEVRVSVVKDSAAAFTIREISNNPGGYEVFMETDATGVTYGGQSIQVREGQAILSQVRAQDRSVDVTKSLQFTSKPNYVRIVIKPLG